ncbi:MAG: MBL fold metallo-hydrolase [Thermoplasmata archaeon]
MELRWHGHSCFEIRGSRAVVFDPHDGKSIGIPPPSASTELLFITHEHFDHNAIRSIGGDPRVIGDVHEGSIDGVSVRTYVLPHDDVGGRKRGMVRCYGLEMDDISFLFLGDVGNLPPEDLVRRERGVSILFLPVGGVFTIGPKEAVEWLDALQPGIAVPMHYRVGGISLSIKPVEEFLALVKRKILKVGQAVSFQRDDLSGEPLVWVFSR